MWRRIGSAPHDSFLLLYAEEWKNLDFNPTGVREGFWDEFMESWFSVWWNDSIYGWDTDPNSHPTHWRRIPKPPIGG